MIQQSFCQGPFLVSGLHGDQILNARDNQQDTFSILVGEDAFLLVLGRDGRIYRRRTGQPCCRGIFQGI